MLYACFCLRVHVPVVKLHIKFITPTAKLWERSRDVKAKINSVLDCFVSLMLKSQILRRIF